MAKAKVVDVSAELGAKLSEWSKQQSELATVKAKEFELRAHLVQNAGFDINKLEGTETLELKFNGEPTGYKLKATKDQNYSLTNKNGETVTLLQFIGEKLNRPDIAQSLVKWQPEISESVYKKELLPLVATNPELAQALSVALTVKPGAPRLELIPPEPKKE